jgi:hypothetical protein
MTSSNLISLYFVFLKVDLRLHCKGRRTKCCSSLIYVVETTLLNNLRLGQQPKRCFSKKGQNKTAENIRISGSSNFNWVPPGNMFPVGEPA